MRKRSFKTKLLSMLLAIAMVVTSITVWPTAQKEVQAATDDYVELTFKDFGLEDGIYEGANWYSNTYITSLDGVAITGDVIFTSNGMHQGFRLDSMKDDWANFQIYRADTEIHVRHFGASSFKLESDESKEMAFTSAELGNADLSTETVRIRVCFDKIDETSIRATVTLTVGDTTITKIGIIQGVSEMVSNASGYRIGPAGSVGADGVFFYSVERTYTELTFNDFGLSDGTYEGANWYSNTYITSLNGVAITGDVIYTSNGMHQGFRLDPMKDDWANFQIYRADAEIHVRHFGASSFRLASDATKEMAFTSAELGNADLSTETIRMRLCFDKTSETSMRATVTLTVGDTTITKIGIIQGVSEMVSNASGYRIGPAGSVGADGVSFYSVERTYTELTFKDFGMEDGTYEGANWYSNTDITSLNGVAITGDVIYTSNGMHQGLRLDPINKDDWANFQIYRADAEIHVRHFGASSFKLASDATKEMAFTSAELGNADLSTETVRVRVCFDKIDATSMRATVTLTVGNATVTKVGIIQGVAEMVSNAAGYRIGPAGSVGSDGVSFYSVNVNNEYTELTFSDFGMEDKLYTSPSWYPKTDITSLDKVVLVGDVIFVSNGMHQGFRLDPMNDDWANFQIYRADTEIHVRHFGASSFKLESDATKEMSFTSAELGNVDLSTETVQMEVYFDKISDTSMRATVTLTVGQTTATKIGIIEGVAEMVSSSAGYRIGPAGSVGETGVAFGSVYINREEPAEPEAPLAVSFNSFGLEANKILGMELASTKVPENTTTLDNMDFTGYVTFFNANDTNTYVTFAVNKGGNGIQMFVSGDTLWIWDKTGGRTAAGLGECFDSFSASELGLDTLVGQELKIEVSFTYTDTGVTVYYAVNGVEKSSYQTVAGFADYIGTGIKVTSSGNPIAYRSSLGAEYSVNSLLENAGYKRVTVTDFDGIEYDKVYQGGTFTGRYADADNMSGTYLDMDVKFEDITIIEGDGAAACIRYAGNGDGWTGIDIRSNGEYNTFEVGGQSITYSAIGLNSIEDVVNIKIALKGTTVDGTQCYLMSAWVNNIQICADKQMVSGTLGNVFLLWVPAEHKEVTNTSKVTFMPTEYVKVTKEPASFNLRKYNHTTVQNYLVTGTATVTKDGASYTVTNNQISEPGDYTIVTTVASKAYEYTQNVALYILGDVDLNGTAGTSEDLNALKGLIKTNTYVASKAAEYAADLDNDGKVGKKDLELMESVVGDASQLLEVLKKYHVPAVAYDYLGGNDVMPIAGFYGPYVSNDGQLDYINDDIFQKIKDSGINMINQTVNDAGYEMAYIQRAMSMADKYGIGWLVSDYTLNPKIDVLNNYTVNTDASMLTTAQLAARLGQYAYYDSFFGFHIVDEPSYNGGDEQQDHKILDYYLDSSKQLNSFANFMGVTNLVAEDARTVNNYNWLINSWRTQDNYDEYWEQFASESNAKVYSADDYAFFTDKEDAVSDADSYFRTLGMMRNQSLANSTPFWYYVAAGGDFDHDEATTNTERIATEAETYWSVNTALAFGAKGIEWFTTIQPAFFDGISDPSTEDSLDRNGLILSDGTTSTYYDWAKNANAQIAAVDEVLMKSTSTAIVASGGYAKSQAVGSENVTTVESSHGKLSGVTSSNTTYGALVGCFDYRDTEAFYVMNYNVSGTDKATITLTLDGAYDYRCIADAVETYGTADGNTITLSLAPGKAALIVLEDRVVEYSVTELAEYYNANGNMEMDAEPGYLFAGWFSADSCERADRITDISAYTGSKVYAKFVADEILGVKAQINAGAKVTDSSISLRFVTSVDSLEYAKIGFKVVKKSTGASKTTESTIVYKELSANYNDGTNKTYIASDLFSTMSVFFHAYAIKNIPQDAYGEEYEVTPYWITWDGTTVYGDTEVKSVNMGLGL